MNYTGTWPKCCVTLSRTRPKHGFRPTLGHGPRRTELTDQEYREEARKLHHKDGQCEIDHDAIVSRGADNGAYVQAWVWVDDEED